MPTNDPRENEEWRQKDPPHNCVRVGRRNFNRVELQDDGHPDTPGYLTVAEFLRKYEFARSLDDAS